MVNGLSRWTPIRFHWQIFHHLYPMRAPMSTRTVHFYHLPKGVFSDIGNAGMQDVTVGYPEFDEVFIIKATMNKTAKAVSNQKSELIIAQRISLFRRGRRTKVLGQQWFSQGWTTLLPSRGCN